MLRLLVATAAVAACTAASTAQAVQPTPNGPVFGGVPGALPTGFHYVYDSPLRSWPVDPAGVQHPIRGSFTDPRGADDDALGGYHFGLDVNVDDRAPDPGAPPGLGHRVYALESGTAGGMLAGTHRCINQRLDVGHFSYWHVQPVVAAGTRVRAGQQVGWTCLGAWHVHVSEWQLAAGHRVWVNPLHRGGAFAPYADTAPPVVRAVRFTTPPRVPWTPTKSLAQPDTSTPLPPSALHGLVEVRANVDDPQSFLGFLAHDPAWPTDFTPYRVGIRITSASGRAVLERTSFQADQLPQTPYLVHYAPGTVEDDNMLECVGPPPLPHCAGTTWVRPLSRFREEYWDTRRVPNGPYVVTVTAADIAGNTATRSTAVTVRN